jgi:hypothetical protein
MAKARGLTLRTEPAALESPEAICARHSHFAELGFRFHNPNSYERAGYVFFLLPQRV